ncbi:MAG: PilT/PilU family type 4a pilus ATPase [Lentisphaerota bacterium]|jgi:twitching motility protein PilT
MPKIDRLLDMMVKDEASDLHLSTGQRPFLRIHGVMTRIATEPILTSEAILGLLHEIIHEDGRVQLEQEMDTDFAYKVDRLGRFRVNGFHDMNGVGAVFRLIPDKIPTFDQLSMPQALHDLCYLSKGLVLVTGPTGSGKSTTLAAMIDHINRHRSEHVITIEDPIEFVHQPIKCLINQREVHHDTKSFARALRAALREDPDIVLVGEMRDLETIEIAIETAETGHLVFGTLHTNNAATAVDRVIDKFPSERQNQIRSMLSDTLKGVVAQTLCQKIGGGRLAAFEVMMVNVPVANHIREGKIFMIPSVMQVSRAIGMQTFSDALTKLVTSGRVTANEAYIKAIDKEEMQVALKNAGVSLAFLDELAIKETEARRQAFNEKIEPLRATLRSRPDDIGTLNDLAWILATCSIPDAADPKEALQLAERVVKLSGGDTPSVLDTLAAAQAAAGNTRRAADTLRKAIKLSVAAGLAVDPLLARLKLYEAGKIFREN